MPMPRALGWTLVGLLVSTWVHAADEAGFEGRVVPLLRKYCVECHGGSKPEGELSFDAVEHVSHVDEHPELWEDVVLKLRRHAMPPAEHPQPSSQEAKAADQWISAHLDKLAQSQRPNPGRVTMRRLNRVEYNNTIRDLVGVDFKPADDFPADDTGYGFDNIGDVLSLAPLLMEKYLAAAEQIVNQAIVENVGGELPDAHLRIIVRSPLLTNPDQVAKESIQRFAERAYRRPVSDQEINRLFRLYEQTQQDGATFEQAMRVALTAILVSPHFLFRIEIDEPGSGQDGLRSLNEFELASRLSYFLWSSLPDEDLFEAARRGGLRQGEALVKQVKRMLDDPKSSALVESFAVQWLQLRKLGMMTPDSDRFSGFSAELRDDMRRETELFFEAVMREDRPITDLLDADFSFLNERLAKHYGIEGVQGDEFRRVTVSRETRGGILTHASVLTLTSNPTRTSPVKRGKWVLENLLGTPPPPPPPGVPQLADERQGALVGTLRERMEQHRSDSACGVCHDRIDPLGFGLENYDAIGRWRSSDGDGAIDATGTLPDGSSFHGPGELKKLLVARTDEFARCFVEKMLTYGLGRGLAREDRRAVDKIVDLAGIQNYKFREVVLAIVESQPFLERSTKEIP